MLPGTERMGSTMVRCAHLIAGVTALLLRPRAVAGAALRLVRLVQQLVVQLRANLWNQLRAGVSIIWVVQLSRVQGKLTKFRGSKAHLVLLHTVRNDNALRVQPPLVHIMILLARPKRLSATAIPDAAVGGLQARTSK